MDGRVTIQDLDLNRVDDVNNNDNNSNASDESLDQDKEYQKEFDKEEMTSGHLTTDKTKKDQFQNKSNNTIQF